MIITDLALLENIDVSVGGTLSDLHIGDGSAVAGALTGVVSTAIDYDVAAPALGATDNIIDFGSVATGTAGIAAALAGGTNATTIKESGAADFTDGDALLFVVRNTGANITEIGHVVVGGTNGLNGAGETFTVVAQSTNTLTSAEVAGLIDLVA